MARLKDQTVLITRAKDQSAKLRELFEAEGARIVELPLIKIIAPSDTTALDGALKKIGGYSWIIFTSVNGVEFFFKRFDVMRLNIDKAFGTSRVVAIGPATAKALTSRGVIIEALPKEFRAEGLIDILSREGLLGRWILIPRAKEAREILPETLREMGAKVDVPTTYETVPNEEVAEHLRELLINRKLTLITFTSSSTVKSFVKLSRSLDLSKMLDGVIIVCIGPVTAQTAMDNGITVNVVADSFTVEGMMDSIINYFASDTGKVKEGS